MSADLSEILAGLRAERAATDGQTDLDAYAKAVSDAGRRHGEQASVAAEDPLFIDDVIHFLWSLRPGETTDADEVRERFGRSMAVGAIFAKAQRAGWIKAVGFAVSSSPTRHGGVLRRWERT